MSALAVTIAKEAHNRAITAADNSGYKHQSRYWNEVYHKAYEKTVKELESGGLLGNSVAPETFVPTIHDINDVDTTTPEGKLLTAAIGLIIKNHPKKEFDEVIAELNVIANQIYGEV